MSRLDNVPTERDEETNTQFKHLLVDNAEERTAMVADAQICFAHVPPETVVAYAVLTTVALEDGDLETCCNIGGSRDERRLLLTAFLEAMQRIADKEAQYRASVAEGGSTQEKGDDATGIDAL